MNLIVCVKQVPGTNKVEVDEQTGVLKRDGVESKMNPYDLFAVETALRLREKHGGTITAVTMGPPQAKSILLEAFAMGVDKGVLLTDRKFGGADVLATSYTIASGIKAACPKYDLIICGKQTTDGDTAQVGPEMSEWLNLPAVCCVTAINDSTETHIDVELELADSIEQLRISYPCLVTVDKDIFMPRLPSYKLKKVSTEKEITCISLGDLPDKNEKHYGLSGSPTQVQKIFPPPARAKNEIWVGSDDELSERLFDRLRDQKLV